jgi:hypothetical protein
VDIGAAAFHSRDWVLPVRREAPAANRSRRPAMTAETDALRAMAEKCRRLAKGVSTTDVAERLNLMADDYARQAEQAAADEPRPAPPPTPA